MAAPSSVTVIGAGVMGRGIAYVAALAGSTTRLVDLDSNQLDDAVRRINLDLDAGIERAKVSDDQAAHARALLSTTTDMAQGCDDADLVIEAVVERMDVKHQVLAVAEQHAAPDAILASNTSSMSITEIISCLSDPSRGVGMHFFNPVPKMRLCELIRGLQTSDETLDGQADSAY